MADLSIDGESFLKLLEPLPRLYNEIEMSFADPGIGLIMEGRCDGLLLASAVYNSSCQWFGQR